MAFLRTLFWIVITVVVMVFSIRNWMPVPVNLFGDTVVETKLPVLLFIAFLIGFLPAYVWHRAFKWQQGRKVLPVERSMTAPPPSAPASTAPERDLAPPPPTDPI